MKSFYKQVAKELGISERVVKEVYISQFYFARYICGKRIDASIFFKGLGKLVSNRYNESIEEDSDVGESDTDDSLDFYTEGHRRHGSDRRLSYISRRSAKSDSEGS